MGAIILIVNGITIGYTVLLCNSTTLAYHLQQYLLYHSNHPYLNLMSESRQDLLAWLNDLLKLNYTKIEQVGTGAAICQVFDSIYGDVQVSKVKFNTLQEYEYVK